MALLNLFSTLTLFYFSFLICNAHSSKYVPILMWNTVKSDSPLPALSRIYKEDFKDIISDKLQNKNSILVVFAEESLSPEDFISYDFNGDPVFAQISNIKSKWQSNYYPHVENPIQVLKKLNTNIREISYAKAKNLKVEPGQVIIIDLNDARENENRATMLGRHDSFMYMTYKKLISEHKDVIALYTGRHSSWLSPNEQEDHGRQRRHLLAAGDDPTNPEPLLILTENIIMYASDMKNIVYKIVEKENETSFTLTCPNNTKPSNVTETVIELPLECTDDSKDVKKYTITFVFVLLPNKYWVLNEVTVLQDTTTVMLLPKIYAPVGFSYHCGKSQIKDVNSTYYLSIPGFQVEPLFINKTSSTKEETNPQMSFSSAYDCVGFTTGPIWSGIFVTFILALIMTFGLCMIMDIKTMDRFDDPKGKTISINVSE